MKRGPSTGVAGSLKNRAAFENECLRSQLAASFASSLGTVWVRPRENESRSTTRKSFSFSLVLFYFSTSMCRRLLLLLFLSLSASLIIPLSHGRRWVVTARLTGQAPSTSSTHPTFLGVWGSSFFNSLAFATLSLPLPPPPSAYHIQQLLLTLLIFLSLSLSLSKISECDVVFVPPLVRRRPLTSHLSIPSSLFFYHQAIDKFSISQSPYLFYLLHISFIPPSNSYHKNRLLIWAFLNILSIFTPRSFFFGSLSVRVTSSVWLSLPFIVLSNESSPTLRCVWWHTWHTHTLFDSSFFSSWFLLANGLVLNCKNFRNAGKRQTRRVDDHSTPVYRSNWLD